jgi:hypothetical protein
MRHAVLLLAFLAPAASAQDIPATAPPDDAEVQFARAKPCIAFLKEVEQQRAAGRPPGQAPSFALVWGWLLGNDPQSGGYMGKLPLGHIMFDNTLLACQRMRERTLGATMDAEYARL